jgi:hypothetical protein
MSWLPTGLSYVRTLVTSQPNTKFPHHREATSGEEVARIADAEEFNLVPEDGLRCKSFRGVVLVWCFTFLRLPLLWWDCEVVLIVQ